MVPPGTFAFVGKIGRRVLKPHPSVYTWSAYLPSNTYGLEGIPMFWGPDKLGEFQQLVKQGYASHVLGFNE
jgi:hypothetical protein